MSLVYSSDSGRIPFGYAEFTRNRAATFTEVGAKNNIVKSGTTSSLLEISLTIAL